MTEHDEDLTAEEQARFVALARNAVPDAAAEDRVVGALAARGLLRRPRRTAWRVAAALAASVSIFFAGYALGRRAAAPPRATVAVARQVVWF
jgi:hypothetical protein